MLFKKILILFISISSYSVSSDDKSCYEVKDFKSLSYYMEYQNVRLSCLLFVKKKCRSKPIKLIWKKNENIISNKKKLKVPRQIKSEIKLLNVTKDDSGNYTCIMQNAKFSFTGNITLTIKSGTPAMRVIRENTVPQIETQLEKNRVYWMPEMNNNKLMHSLQIGAFHMFDCHFFVQSNYSIQWFVSREPPVNKDNEIQFGNHVNNNSRYKTSIFKYECDLDPYMNITTGDCYNTALEISYIDSRIHEYYTCVIDNQINATHRIIIENYDFNPSDYYYDINNFNFSENSTICAGNQFIFSCNTTSIKELILVQKINYSESQLKTSFGNLIYNLNSSAESDSGMYICKLSNNIEKSMHLTVVSCINYYVLNFITAFIGTIILFVVLLFFFIIIRRMKIAFQLKNSNRVYVMRRIVLKDVIQNPDYISTPLNSKLEISRDRVNISPVKLGEGNFGCVYRGWVDSKEVAIKIASELGQNMLSDEVQMMQQIGRHRHILELVGVCFDEGSLWAIMELASLGSLKNYLQSCNPSINQPCKEIELDQLFVYSLQIGRGMEYLASKSIIHRDLATRNILLSENGDIKIADFGLTRIVINYYHSMSDDSRPLRWMAPESFIENRFTTKSDVWSFGIVLWEIFTLGVVPYFSFSFHEIRDAVCSGVINDRPDIAPEWIYELMKKCWRFDEDLRPIFADIVSQLESANSNEYI